MKTNIGAGPVEESKARRDPNWNGLGLGSPSKDASLAPGCNRSILSNRQKLLNKMARHKNIVVEDGRSPYDGLFNIGI